MAAELILNIPRGKYDAVWVSHSSMGDFLKCPRAYFLRNVYKNARGRKINVVNPALSLGQAVHETIEGLGKFRAEERFKSPLLETFEREWRKVSGKIGGFVSEAEEGEMKERGRAMVRRVLENPGPLQNKTVKIPNGRNDMPPNFYLSEEENIILCGKIDWLEYLADTDSVRIIDFKTGKHDESAGSLQLPIYRLLLDALQKRKVAGAAYWYLDRSDRPEEVALPEVPRAREQVLRVARRVREARLKEEFNCPRGEAGCFACRPFEKILRGETEMVGVGGYNQELHLVS